MPQRLKRITSKVANRCMSWTTPQHDRWRATRACGRPVGVAGFTLVELLMAMTVLSIVIGAATGSLLIATAGQATLKTKFAGKATAIVAPVGNGRGKFRGIVHQLAGSPGYEHVRDFLGIENMGSTQERQAQRCGFQQVMTADGDETSGDKGHVTGRIEERQLAHRIAEKYLGICAARLALGSRYDAHALLFDHFAHGSESLRMPRYQHQQQFGM